MGNLNCLVKEGSESEGGEGGGRGQHCERKFALIFVLAFIISDDVVKAKKVNGVHRDEINQF